MELPKRKQNRITGYDYSKPGAYFITICTDKRRNLFWENVGAIIDRPEDVVLSEAGRIVERCIDDISNRYHMVCVDWYVIMPNHIHLLMRIDTDSDGRPMVAPTISTVVQQMKGAASKEMGFSLWQKGYHDHVIRGERDYREIWEYIDDNPRKWKEDRLNSE